MKTVIQFQFQKILLNPHAAKVITCVLLCAVLMPASARAAKKEPVATPGLTHPSGEEAKIALDRAAKAWTQMDDIVKQIKPPTFPEREFSITSYGAVADGTTDCTQAFKDAIEACNKAGGGKVVVPAGVFLTGAIHLKSNVNLHLAKDATVRFSTDLAKYLPVVFARYESTEVMNYSPFIYAFEQENIAVTGEGTLDGQASAGVWYSWKKKGAGDEKKLVKMGDENVPVEQRVFGEGHQLRTNFVQPIRCKNVLIEGVRLTNSPMWVLNPSLCTNVIIRNVRVDSKGKTGTAPNTDGCDPDACTNVLIDGCVFNTDDDCIAIKSGRDNDGRRVGVPCTNVVVRNCKFEAGHGGVTAGSETAAGIRNVFVEKCSFDSTDLKMAIRLKTNPQRGGFIENFNVRDCTVKTANFGIHMTMQYEKVTSGDAVPYIRNVNIQDVKFENLTKEPVYIEGLSDRAKITDVTIANCVFPKVKRPSTVTFADGIRVINTTGLD